MKGKKNYKQKAGKGILSETTKQKTTREKEKSIGTKLLNPSIFVLGILDKRTSEQSKFKRKNNFFSSV